MKCSRIEAHFTKSEVEEDRAHEKVNKTIVAFNKRYHFHGIVRHGLAGDGVIAVYLLEPEAKPYRDKRCPRTDTGAHVSLKCAKGECNHGKAYEAGVDPVTY